MEGPFRIKGMVNQRVEMKVWVIASTCINVGSIYMNMDHKQYTTAFIMACESFINIMGRARYMYSVKGFNIIAGARYDTK